MQKQAKQMLIVLALLIVFGAAYGGMRMYNQKQEEKQNRKEEEEKVLIAGVKQEDITAFSYQNGEDTLEFVKEEDAWITKNAEEMKLDQSTVESLLEKIASLEAEETVEGAGSPSEYGLDSPENVITVTTADGTETLFIGMQNAITDQYYLQKGENGTIYLVSSAFPSAFEKPLADFEEQSEETEEINDTQAE